MRYTLTHDIDASADEVWRVLRDVENWPQWTPTMRRIRPLSGGPLAVGSRYRVEQPRLLPAVWEVTACEPGRSFTWATRSPGVTTVAEHLLTPRPDGVRMVQNLDQTGPLERLIRPLFGGLVRRYVETEGQGLKAYCERR